MTRELQSEKRWPWQSVLPFLSKGLIISGN